MSCTHSQYFLPAGYSIFGGDETHSEYLTLGVYIMENFKHLPEPFRIRVIEPVKRTTRAYREEAIVRAGMNPSCWTARTSSSIC